MFKLFIHFGRIRANTLGDVEQIKIIMSGAVRLSAVRIALYELFMHTGRIRTVTQGACATCCIFCVIICQLKYNIVCLSCWDFGEQLIMMCNVPIRVITISVRIPYNILEPSKWKGRIRYLRNSKQFVSNGNSVNYSILFGPLPSYRIG